MHRRLICCVLAIEIAEHERKPLFEQIRLTQDLRHVLAEAAAAVPAEDIVAIGREDGALLGFVSDPAACFAAALAVRDAYLAGEQHRALQPRVGIDAGPIELIEDEESGALRLGGDARRDAERLMRQSPPGQIAVSRAFFELLCRVAPDLAAPLKDRGLLTDTAGRPLGWYALQAPALTSLAGAAGAPAAAPAARPARRARGARRFAFLPLVAALAALVPWNRVPPGEPALPAALSGNVAAGAAEPIDAAHAPDSSAPDATEEWPEAGDRRPVAVPPASPRAATRQAAPGVRVPGRDAPAHGAKGRTGPHVGVRSETLRTPARPAPRPAAAAPKAAAAPPRQPHADASEKVLVRLAVRPWGEVRIAGRAAVISPPVKTLRLPPGRYAVAIVNGTLPPLRRELILRAGAGPVTLAHDFSCVAVRDQLCPEAADAPPLASNRLRPRSSEDRMDALLSVAGRTGRPDLAAASASAAATLERRALAAR
jgi:hypothetical protein